MDKKIEQKANKTHFSEDNIALLDSKDIEQMNRLD